MPASEAITGSAHACMIASIACSACSRAYISYPFLFGLLELSFPFLFFSLSHYYYHYQHGDQRRFSSGGPWIVSRLAHCEGRGSGTCKRALADGAAQTRSGGDWFSKTLTMNGICGGPRHGFAKESLRLDKQKQASAEQCSAMHMNSKLE